MAAHSDHSFNKRLTFVLGLCFAALSIFACGCGNAHYDAALDAFQQGDYEQAHAAARRAVQDDPDKKHLAILAWTHMKQGEMGEAQTVLEQLHDEDPTYIEYYQAMAWFKLLNGEPEESRRWFVKELNWAKRHMRSEWFPEYYRRADVEYIRNLESDAHYGFGLISLQKENFTLARAELKKALERKEYGAVESIQKTLDGADSLEKYASASKQSQQARKLLKHGAYALLAEFAQEQRESAEPTELFQYYYILGLIGQGKSALAQNELTTLRNMNAHYVDTVAMGRLRDLSPPSLLTLAQAHFNHGDYLLASQTLELLPENSLPCELKMQQAWTTLYLGGFEEASAEFEALRTQQCGGAEAYVGQAVALIYLDELSLAEYYLNKALELAPNMPRAKSAFGAVAFKRKDYADALRIYRENQALLPPFERAWSWGAHALNNMGWCLLELERPQEAEQVFRRLETYLQGRPYPQITNGLAWAALKQGRTDTARRLFKETLELSPDFASAQEGLEKLSKSRLSASAE